MVEGLNHKEKLTKPALNIFLLNMEGELNLSYHEPIGIEVIAGRLLRDFPNNIGLQMYDTQPELVKYGKIQTDRLVEKIHTFSKSASCPLLLGISVPIGSWEYTKSLLIKLEQNPPEVPVTIVLGNAIATFTDPDLLKKDFPNIKLVVGEGEEAFSDIAQQIITDEPVEDRLTASLPDLEKYSLPLRAFTKDVIDRGGSVKIEMSRGCPHGNCTFCSRCIRGGKDYRVVPEEIVVQQLQELLDEFSISGFETSDEESCGNLEKTARLISSIKSAELPRVPFAGSFRPDILIELENNNLLNQLIDIGLQKVFIGAEGGSDAYLRQLNKNQSVQQIEQAIEIVKQKSLDFELGFITFSWRMTFNMLRENVEFLSREDYAQHVSLLFNEIVIRAGNLEERILKNHAARGEIGDYNPADYFSINYSKYTDVPFLDPKVKDALTIVKDYANESKEVYYALKSLVRSGSIPELYKKQLEQYYNALKLIGLKLLRQVVEIDAKTDLKDERDEIIAKINNLIGSKSTGDVLDFLRREIKIFLVDQDERKKTTSEQVGSLIVLTDSEKGVFLVRSRGDEQWSFPGGNIRAGKDIVEEGLRETLEELGNNDITIKKALRTTIKKGHIDATTGYKKRLTLYHHLAHFNIGVVPEITEADHEIVDFIWLSPEEIINGKVNVRENVLDIVKDML